MLIPKENVDKAFASAACIGCGACVAACPNASGMLFMGAKVNHLGLLPQGQPEREARVVSMVNQHDAEGFGGCTNIGDVRGSVPEGDPDGRHLLAEQGPAVGPAPPPLTTSHRPAPFPLSGV